MRSDLPRIKNELPVWQWIDILTYYQDNEKNLTNEECLVLYHQSELCRFMFNEKTKYDKCERDQVYTSLYERVNEINT